MPVIVHEQAGRSLAKHAMKLATRDDSEDDGGMKGTTKIGIAIGLICFFTLLVSFWVIARYRKKRVPPTAESQFGAESLGRWMSNLTRPHPRSPPPGYGHGSATHLYDMSERTRRASMNTFTTYTTHGEANQEDGYQLPPHPAPAYLASTR